MVRDMLAGKHAAVAVADDDRILVTFSGQVSCCKLIVFDTFRDGLISAAHSLAAVIGAHRIVAAPIERHKIVAERGDVRCQKTRGTDVEIHLIAVAIHRRALARNIGRVEDTVERMGRRRDADEFGPHKQYSFPAKTSRGFSTKNQQSIDRRRQNKSSLLYGKRKKSAVSRQSRGQSVETARAASGAGEA